MFDVRAIANFILDLADRHQIEVTNMALNKITYFVHCDFLLENDVPLVEAKIEAWQHGPVFREVYHEFKKWNDSAIHGRATKVDPETGEIIEARAEVDPKLSSDLTCLIERYIGFSASQLRAISHREGGPWAAVWGHDGRSNPGMKISNELIVRYYTPEVRQ